MNGCPHCHAERLKAAPIFAVSTLLKSVSSRRRYVCTQCGWVGWRHRLQRRHSELPSLSPKAKPSHGAIAFFVFVLVFFIVTGALLMQSCQNTPEPGAPITQAPAPHRTHTSGLWRSV